MGRLTRREFVQQAATFGAVLIWGTRSSSASTVTWNERRDVFPQGVASGDPDPNSVILWTRRPPGERQAARLTVEIAEDAAFRRVVGKKEAAVTADTDWTCRVLAAGLQPRTVYWYRFTDEHGFGSRVGRTITAPTESDARPVNFTFVSCQSVNEGKLNGYRRMIFEDERARPADQLGFVLHLGDFIYEVVQYPEEGATRYDRTIYEVCRIPDAGKTGNLYWPKTVDGYRAVWKGYLADPDLQDARARWPFVCMWDNHEFSWQGRQSILQQGGPPQPGQTVKVAANQAWFEYIPARVTPPSGSLAEFGKVAVENVKIDKWDENGLGTEPNNLAAIRSLIAYRAFRYGKHLDLIVTDQRSFAGEDASNVDDVGKIYDPAFRGYFSEEAMIALDAGKAYNDGKPPAELQFRDVKIPNPSKNKNPRTILGVEQKRWFKDRLRNSKATWKIWGNSLGALDNRVDMQNLPAGMVKNPWPADTYGIGRTDDFGAAYSERGEIYDLVRDAKITGFAIVSGDRHSFWAGYAAAELPPRKFEPVGLSFVGGSMISPGAMEALEHGLRKEHPLRALFLADRPDGGKPDWTYNMLLLHGVRSCLEYAKNFDLKRAHALSNPQLAPHLKFLDWGGHGYAKVRLSANEMRTEFVCIPRPITRSESPDGGPLRYRVVHTAKLWKPGERPLLEVKILEGSVGLSI
ncbi:MAG TPA: alkaline phosphatase D family protein [Pyrinomonadaceae bacterium]|nr:alkaline phosphatase D family protein [Pyrinomonadaceae bacterium]